MERLLLSREARRKYESAAAGAGRLCVRLGLSASILTFSSVLLAAVTAFLLATERFPWALATGTLSCLLDMLDGSTARAAGTQSGYGTLLDRAADRFNEMLFLLGFLLSGHARPAVVLVALFALLFPSYVRAVAESVAGVPDCEVGLAGRLEKLVLLTAGLLVEMALPEYRPLECSLVLVSLIGLVTSAQRLWHARRFHLRRSREGVQR
jgi:phosphatidylglycerophosphate synthase